MNVIEMTPQKLEHLKHELQRIRHQSLQASREGDFRKTARLTVQAADLNKAIVEAESEILLNDF